MAFLRFLTLVIIAFIASVEAQTGLFGSQGAVTAQFSQSSYQAPAPSGDFVPFSPFSQPPQQSSSQYQYQQPAAPQYQYPPQGSPQYQYAAPGPQQYQNPSQGSQQYQFAQPGSQQYQYPSQFAPPAQNQYQNPQQGTGQFQFGAPANPNFPDFQQPNPPSNPNFPGFQQPNPTAPGPYVTFRPITTSPTPIPFQSLEEAQPISIPSSGIPTWMIRYILLSMVQKSTTETTTTTTTAATPYVIPSTYSDWYVFGNCVYKSYLTPKTWDQAKADCESAGARLATVNVKQSSPRNTIFGETSLSTGVAWVGLEDIDGSTTPYLPRWLDLATFVSESTAPTYSTTAGTRSCANVGVSANFAFTNCDTETQKFLCEFCPTF